MNFFADKRRLSRLEWLEKLAQFLFEHLRILIFQIFLIYNTNMQLIEVGVELLCYFDHERF